MAENLGLTSRLIDKYFNISSAYEKLDNQKQALDYFKKYEATKDSVYSEENTKEIVRLEDKFTYEKKEREAELAQKKI